MKTIKIIKNRLIFFVLYMAYDKKFDEGLKYFIHKQAVNIFFYNQTSLWLLVRTTCWLRSVPKWALMMLRDKMGCYFSHKQPASSTLLRKFKQHKKSRFYCFLFLDGNILFITNKRNFQSNLIFPQKLLRMNENFNNQTQLFIMN